MLGVPNIAGSPTSNQVTPLFWVAKIRPTLELMTTSALLTGLTAKLAPPVNGHCGIGGRQAAARLQQAEGPADVATARLARGTRPEPLNPGPMYWKKSVSLPPQQGQKYW